VWGFKIGSILFTEIGPSAIEKVLKLGGRVFLDLKFHDIPKTIAEACLSAAKLGVWMLSLHVMGGPAMLQAARAAIDTLPNNQRPRLIGVTVLTSLNAQDLKAIGIRDSVESTVRQLALLAKTCGLDGVVCSAQEALILRHDLGKDFLLITPGIHLKMENHADQKRTATPEDAIQAGADYLVIGRSITEASNPLQLLTNISIRKQ